MSCSARPRLRQRHEKADSDLDACPLRRFIPANLCISDSEPMLKTHQSPLDLIKGYAEVGGNLKELGGLPRALICEVDVLRDHLELDSPYRQRVGLKDIV